MAKEYIKLSQAGATLEGLEKLTLDPRRAVVDGDLETGSFM